MHFESIFPDRKYDDEEVRADDKKKKKRTKTSEHWQGGF